MSLVPSDCENGATRHTVIALSVIHYASVGGATRHTVIALSVCRSVCLLHHFCGAR